MGAGGRQTTSHWGLAGGVCCGAGSLHGLVGGDAAHLLLHNEHTRSLRSVCGGALGGRFAARPGRGRMRCITCFAMNTRGLCEVFAAEHWGPVRCTAWSGRMRCITGASFTPGPSPPHALAQKNTTLTSGIVVEHRGVDSCLRAWSGPALRLHWSLIHSRPFDSPMLSHKKIPL